MAVEVEDRCGRIIEQSLDISGAPKKK